MNKFEFIKYEPTPSEKHLGIATVKLYGKIIARFKIVNTKDGSTFFPASPSLKLGESYVNAITLDSNSEKEELDAIIKSNVKAILNGETFKATAVPLQYQTQPEQMSFLDSCPF